MSRSHAGQSEKPAPGLKTALKTILAKHPYPTMIQTPSHAAICLEKALAYVNAAKAQIDLVVIEKKAMFGEKEFWKLQTNRLGAITKDVMSRIAKPEARDMIRSEMADEFRLDALLSLYAQLNEEGRDAMEAYAKNLLDGIDTMQKQAA